MTRKKGQKERQAERLEIRFTPTEAKGIDLTEDGKTATWARETLLKAARRQPKT
ncbi:MAG TPA: hypothetical protein VGN12_28290 [Pirellulales bacterium]